ncbi:PREDICTED: FBD-associated F-box protein At3g49020-like [Erythranthe guttata]|uniref:FBD-associated F-box protein At3g49020-like n=1 Tax=Erythranthe guttata TaxID=4155 RepID=UPI00064D8D27|nr:PREDICTED: FBD-associated F-box protein At3g49020-like [Erythranthe guttata]|eukprot:XP_012832872.1 PREDICTED: FBD-associated F-box protein At3g49020-like [Erythranthe guttata]
MCLPRLKRLHLMYVKYEGNESLPHLLSGCPALEELLIHSNTDYESFNISSPTIKRLFVHLHYNGEDSDNEEYCCNYKLEIKTPALVYLHLADDSAKHIECGALNSLIEADIDIKAYINDFIYARSVVKLFDRLRNVKCLKLQLSCYTKVCIKSFFSLMNICLVMVILYCVFPDYPISIL